MPPPPCPPLPPARCCALNGIVPRPPQELAQLSCLAEVQLVDPQWPKGAAAVLPASGALRRLSLDWDLLRHPDSRAALSSPAAEQLEFLSVWRLPRSPVLIEHWYGGDPALQAEAVSSWYWLFCWIARHPRLRVLEIDAAPGDESAQYSLTHEHSDDLSAAAQVLCARRPGLSVRLDTSTEGTAGAFREALAAPWATPPSAAPASGGGEARSR